MAADEQEASQAASGGKGNLIVVLVTAILALAAGAGGAYFLLDPTAKAASDPAAEAVAEAQAQPSSGEDFRERLFSLEPFVVNVTGDGYSRYLKVRMELEADTPDLVEELDARLPQVRDAVIVLLSSKQLSDITDFEGKALLKEDIRMRVNDVVDGGQVNSVLFTEFVVQ